MNPVIDDIAISSVVHIRLLFPLHLHYFVAQPTNLFELLDIGALTEEEFAEQKKLILNELSGGIAH